MPGSYPKVHISLILCVAQALVYFWFLVDSKMQPVLRTTSPKPSSTLLKVIGCHPKVAGVLSTTVCFLFLL